MQDEISVKISEEENFSYCFQIAHLEGERTSLRNLGPFGKKVGFAERVGVCFLLVVAIFVFDSFVVGDGGWLDVEE